MFIEVSILYEKFISVVILSAQYGSEYHYFIELSRAHLAFLLVG